LVGLVVELGGSGAGRLPEPAEQQVEIAGIRLPRLAIAAGREALPLVLAYLQTGKGPD
jgi:hypothetical protein